MAAPWTGAMITMVNLQPRQCGSKPLDPCAKVNSVLTFCSKDRVQGLQENACSLMLEFFQVGYLRKNLISLSTMRKV